MNHQAWEQLHLYKIHLCFWTINVNNWYKNFAVYVVLIYDKNVIVQNANNSHTKFSVNTSMLKSTQNKLKTCARDIILDCLPFSNHKTRLDMIISVEDGSIYFNRLRNIR